MAAIWIYGVDYECLFFLEDDGFCWELDADSLGILGTITDAQEPRLHLQLQMKI